MAAPKFRQTQGERAQAKPITLGDLNQAIVDYSDQMARYVKPAWNVVNPPAGTYIAKPWDYIVCNDALNIVFPESSPANQGTEIKVYRNGIAVSLGGFAITIEPVSGLIGGATGSIGGPAGGYASTTYCSSGKGWHA